MTKRAYKQTDASVEINYLKDIAEFGCKVRARREELDLSLDDLAERINSDKSALSRIENGERIPRFDSVLRLADALKTTPAHLSPSRFLDDSGADMLHQIYIRLTRQTAEQRQTSLRYICAMLDGLTGTDAGRR